MCFFYCFQLFNRLYYYYYYLIIISQHGYKKIFVFLLTFQQKCAMMFLGLYAYSMKAGV